MDIPLYCASPYGFSEAGRYSYQERFLPMIREIGYRVLDPWAYANSPMIQKAIAMPLGEEQRRTWAVANKVLATRNEAAIAECRIMVAVLDGPAVDDGVAAEIGYCYGLGGQRPIIGYRGDFRPTGDNVGSIVNIQIEHFINESGGTITRSLEDLKTTLDGWYEKLGRSDE